MSDPSVRRAGDRRPPIRAYAGDPRLFNLVMGAAWEADRLHSLAQSWQTKVCGHALRVSMPEAASGRPGDRFECEEAVPLCPLDPRCAAFAIRGGTGSGWLLRQQGRPAVADALSGDGSCAPGSLVNCGALGVIDTPFFRRHIDTVSGPGVAGCRPAHAVGA
jgi:hypothetical protein